ncbi:RNA polymerase sigma factor [Paenibacillus eucommiae]|uniref:RNA polymerase sigma-70 factor (ECF subfamily) n=1 Tax=Paenibacillus eucommiae TaxID=1355755 RepID=A0ABS4IWG9_9BACL|nr:RNA polymerase sigma factor [Paenibacillus eucommiae]MBP1990869.1 RNA polymerase sigma-70 factor (ECF subfamily) [Paenibacillus eucommiae]
MDIQEIMEKVRQGDSNAYEMVIRMYQQRIFTFCYYMLGNQQEAEDAVQDIFLKAYKHLSSYRHEHSFYAWLHRIAHNHCNNLLKRKRKWRLLLPMFRPVIQEKSAEQIFSEQMSTEIVDWLKDLSAVEKQILLLRVLEDLSFDEIAQALEAKPAAVRKRFERIKKKLQQTKRRDDIHHEQRYELRQGSQATEANGSARN